LSTNLLNAVCIVTNAADAWVSSRQGISGRARDPREYRRQEQIGLVDHGGSHELPAQLTPSDQDLAQRQPYRAPFRGFLCGGRQLFPCFPNPGGGRQHLGFGLIFALDDGRQFVPMATVAVVKKNA
jgi:hypothetical protein